MRFAPSLFLVLSLLLPFAAPTQAALGGNENSIAADQTQMNATQHTSTASQYSLHELQEASGTVVREYVSSQGRVFAISWKGPVLPDLQQLMGSSFGDYAAAVNSKAAGGGPLQIKLPGLVVQSGGRMRAFVGYAYIPQLMPAGVAIDDIQ